MKKIFTIIIVLLCAGTTYAQLTMTSNAQLVVNSGSTVIANGGITATNATITNNGTIENKGDLVNNTSGLFDNTSSGIFKFNGSTAQEIKGTADAYFYGTLEIDNTSGVSLTSTSQSVNGTLTFTNGKLKLNTYDLTIGTTDPTGAAAGKYVETNSTGGVKRNVPNTATSVNYPVGNSAYNLLILENSATATGDDYTVRVLDYEPKNAGTSNMVNRSWEVVEGTGGGSELTVTPQWNSGEESSFTRSNCAVGLTMDNGSTYTWKAYSAATGGDPYTQTGLTYADVGLFAVADKDYVSDNTDVTDLTIANTDVLCFNAINTLYVADNGDVTIQAVGGDATFIAGNLIKFYPGFTAESGTTVDAHITTTSTYCGMATRSMLANDPEELEDETLVLTDIGEIDDTQFNIYPNPNTGKFKIDFMGNPYPDAEIYIVSFRGQKMQNMNTLNRNEIDIDLSYYPNGVYLVVIKTADKVVTKRIVKM